MYKLSKADHLFIEQHRGVYLPAPAWYAVMTHWGRERRVHDMILNEVGHDRVEEALLPELRVSPEPADKPAKEDLLFGGYVFVRCLMNDAVYLRINADPHVFKIIGRAFRIPLVISEEEMKRFKGVLESVPQPRLVDKCQLGRLATVSSGLMQGLQGRVIGVATHYVKLEAEFSFLDPGKCLVVSVPHDQILMIDEKTDLANA